MKSSIYILLIIILYSCQTDKEQVEETIFTNGYTHWKSLSISHHANNIWYKATLVPIQYYLYKNAGILNIDSLYELNKRERIIEVEFKEDSGKDLLETSYTHLPYDQSVIYMAFKIENDYILITDKNDSIACSGVIFERNYKVAPYKRLLLFFSDVDPQANVSLIYNDNLFNNGLFKFNFTKRPIKL